MNRWGGSKRGTGDVAVETRQCPHCKAEMTYKGADGKTTYSCAVMVTIPGVYDGGLYILCPYCNGRWHRFPEGHPLRERAAPYVDEQ